MPHAAVLNRLQWQWRELPYATDEQHCIFKTSLTFVDSVSEIWGPLLQGRTIVIVSKHITRDPERFVSVLEKYKVSTYGYVLLEILVGNLLFIKQKRTEVKETKKFTEKKNL